MKPPPPPTGIDVANGNGVHEFRAVTNSELMRSAGDRNGSRAAERHRREREQERRSGRGRRGNASATRISVVIPALNEALNLRHVLANLPDGLFEVVLVPGSSTDDTETVARRLRPDIRIIHQDRRGKGNALACGFDACRGDIIVSLDADGSADPKEIPAFVGALLAGADFAKGTRYIQGGGSHDMTILRRLGNWGLTKLANLLHGTGYSDLCYGYNAFWRSCLPQINVDIDGFEVETLVNLRVAKSGLRVAEVASFELARIHGDSNLKTFRDGWRVLGTILREWVPKHHRTAHTTPARLEAGRRMSDRRSATTDTSQPTGEHRNGHNGGMPDGHDGGSAEGPKPLPRAAQLVSQELINRGHAGSIRLLDESARSAAEAASALSVSQQQIVKSLIFRGLRSSQPILALVGGTSRVDPQLLEDHVGEPVERAGAEWVKEQTGFAIGGVPPVGHRQDLRTVADTGLVELTQLWAAAGTPHAVFAMRGDELEPLTGAEMAPIAARSAA